VLIAYNFMWRAGSQRRSSARGAPGLHRRSASCPIFILATSPTRSFALGDDYAGYFNVGDSERLAQLMDRAERDPAFLAGLKSHCAGLKPLFNPARELTAWRRLILECRAGGSLQAPGTDKRP
jgi:hypothetical protein